MEFILDTDTIYTGEEVMYRLRLMDGDKDISTIGVNYGSASDEMCLFWVTDGNNRNKGYGKRTLNEFIRLAKEYGKKSLIVRIANDNIPSIKLAESCGFKHNMEYFSDANEYKLSLED